MKHTIGAPVATKTASLAISSLDEESRSFEVVASTASVDSHGEIVDQTWKLDRFLANPVVLFGHEHSSLPIGRADNVRVEEGQLKARITLVSEKANPFAEQVLALMKEGALRAISVGFRPGKRSTEKRDGREVVVLSDNELMELSVVPIGANPDARAKAADVRPPEDATPRNQSMKFIVKALGLGEETSEADAQKAFESAINELLAATGVESLKNIPAAFESLKTANEVLTEKAAKVEALEAELAKAKADKDAAELEGLIEAASKAGKLPPSKHSAFREKAAKHGLDWARDTVEMLAVQPVAKSEPITAPSTETAIVDEALVKALNQIGSGMTPEEAAKTQAAMKAAGVA